MLDEAKCREYAEAYGLAVQTRCARKIGTRRRVSPEWAEKLCALLDKYKCTAIEWMAVQFDGLPVKACLRFRHSYPPITLMVTDLASVKFAEAMQNLDYLNTSVTMAEISRVQETRLEEEISKKMETTTLSTLESIQRVFNKRIVNRIPEENKIGLLRDFIEWLKEEVDDMELSERVNNKP